MNKLSSFHRFLLRRRVYCAECVGPITATQVIKDKNGYDICVCDFHGGKPQPESHVSEPKEDWYSPKEKIKT